MLDIVDPISTAVQRALRRTGVAGYEPATMATLLALFEHFDPGFTFFDVGANMGLYSAVSAVLFRPAAVVAFEPTPHTAQIAREVMAANGVRVAVEEVALGAESGSAELFLSAVSDSSNSMVEGFKQSVGTATVDVLRLDEYVMRTGREPTIVKIDVETFEPQVIAGATRTIDSARPFIVAEVLHRRGRDHGIELTAAMAGLGYSYFRIDSATIAACSRSGSSWPQRDVLNGNPGSKESDWLLAPRSLPTDFVMTVGKWADRLASCTADRNPPLKPWQLGLATLRRRGVMQATRSGARFVRRRVAARPRPDGA